MNDRKWLNLVIFLISTMIILFLILQKKLELSEPEAKPFGILLDASFEVDRLVLNGRWLPVARLHKELTTKQWLDFQIAWKTIQPEVQLNQLPEIARLNKATELEWFSSKQQRSFKLYLTADGLIIETTNALKATVIYAYNTKQSQRLMPDWLNELAGNN